VLEGVLWMCEKELPAGAARGESSEPACAAGRSTRQALHLQLPALLAGRTVISISFRIVYPFLPAIARGLGISLAQASGLVTLHSLAGLGAPILGPLADRYDRRRMMELALLLLALASLLLAAGGTLVAALVAFALYSVTQIVYDLAMHAHLGDTVPYTERGRAVGVVELSWALGWLLGVPVSGFLIERLGWRAPWALLIGLGLLAAWLIRWRLTPTKGVKRRAEGSSLVAATLAGWWRMLGRPSVVILLLTVWLQALAIEIPFIVYGAWLETSFGLGLGQLGLASIVVGLAEGGAEFGAMLITDRLGKRRCTLLGLLGLAAGLAALPWLASWGLGAALADIALVFFAVEFSFVSVLPLATELVPDARASLFSLVVASFSLSRVMGAPLGGWLWRWQNIAVHAWVGAACALVAAALLLWGIRDYR